MKRQCSRASLGFSFSWHSTALVVVVVPGFHTARMLMHIKFRPPNHIISACGCCSSAYGDCEADVPARWLCRERIHQARELRHPQMRPSDAGMRWLHAPRRKRREMMLAHGRCVMSRKRTISWCSSNVVEMLPILRSTCWRTFSKTSSPRARGVLTRYFRGRVSPPTPRISRTPLFFDFAHP